MAALGESLAPIGELVVTLSSRGGIGPFSELDLSELRRAFDSKFWPLLTTIQAALPHLANDGSITVLGAVTARTAMPATAGIAALNAAVEAIVRPLAAELAPIRVNAVSPGFVDTAWWDQMADDARRAYFDQIAEALPARQIASAEQIADLVVVAATNANITGSVLESDGGLSLVSLAI